jgi:hypothetical protein
MYLINHFLTNLSYYHYCLILRMISHPLLSPKKQSPVTTQACFYNLQIQHSSPNNFQNIQLNHFTLNNPVDHSRKPNTLPHPLQTPLPSDPILRPHLRLRPDPLQNLIPIQTTHKHNNHSPKPFRISFLAQSRTAIRAESDRHWEAGFVVWDSNFLQRRGVIEG